MTLTHTSKFLLTLQGALKQDLSPKGIIHSFREVLKTDLMNSCRELFHLISQSLLVQATVINRDKGPHSDETLAELTPTPLFRAQFKQITQTPGIGISQWNSYFERVT